jgi:hypothetical protein
MGHKLFDAFQAAAHHLLDRHILGMSGNSGYKSMEYNDF